MIWGLKKVFSEREKIIFGSSTMIWTNKKTFEATQIGYGSLQRQFLCAWQKLSLRQGTWDGKMNVFLSVILDQAGEFPPRFIVP
jgi:hypothetical protein